MRKTDSTLIVSFDDTLEGKEIIAATQSTYYNPSGIKLGPGTKPFLRNPFDEIDFSGVKRAILLDVGVWSGKTMILLVEQLRSYNIAVTIIAGFIKEKARQRFEEKGASVESLLPFSDYNDWAEMRDLLVLFIKSGFFIGKQSQKDANRFIPYGTFLGQLTYFTQPSSNLNLRYELLESTDYRTLTLELLHLSKRFWETMEDLNTNLTLGKLCALFPTRFGLPLLSKRQLTQIRFSRDDKPSDAIGKLYTMMGTK